MKKKIIAVDFDGTLVENRYPQIGETKNEILDYCKSQQEKGARIILWTNRADQYLTDAVNWCKDHGLHLDAVNDNLSEVINAFGNNPRKVYADEYIDDHSSQKFVFPKMESDIAGSVQDWAHNEVVLAIARARKESNEREIDPDIFATLCKSALKAYNSLFRDNPEGINLQAAKSILNRLIDGKCLSPIDDTLDIWTEITFQPDDPVKHYQCKRMSSLFKGVSADGAVSYSDMERVRVFSNGDSTPYRNNFVTQLIDQLLPIKMPYYPDNHKLSVYREDFRISKSSTDYDTMGILYAIAPAGVKIDIFRYFKANAEEGWTEISKEEYEKRKARKIK